MFDDVPFGMKAGEARKPTVKGFVYYAKRVVLVLIALIALAVGGFFGWFEWKEYQEGVEKMTFFDDTGSLRIDVRNGATLYYLSSSENWCGITEKGEELLDNLGFKKGGKNKPNLYSKKTTFYGEGWEIGVCGEKTPNELKIHPTTLHFYEYGFGYARFSVKQMNEFNAFLSKLTAKKNRNHKDSIRWYDDKGNWVWVKTLVGGGVVLNGETLTKTDTFEYSSDVWGKVIRNQGNSYCTTNIILEDVWYTSPNGCPSLMEKYGIVKYEDE